MKTLGTTDTAGRVLRKTLGGALAIACTGVLALLSGARYTIEGAEHAVIRLSWRARGELVRACRRLTPEELADLPVHMRREEECARRILPYRLRVTVDGALALDELVRAGGAREDRPLFVFHELSVLPGPHHLAVTFAHEPGGQPLDEAEEDPAHEARETPPFLAVEQTITTRARAIVLVTYDEERKALRLLAPPDHGP